MEVGSGIALRGRKSECYRPHTRDPTRNELMTALGAGRATLTHAVLQPLPTAEHIMGMPAVEPRRWTAEDIRNLPDQPGKRFECVDGELLVSPGPRIPHQVAVAELQSALRAYSHEERLAVVLAGPGELELDPFTLVQPDIFVLPRVNGRVPQTQEEAGAALLLVEVLSPSTARHDRVVKRQRYQRYGVEYWIVDLDARLLERWTPNDDRPEVLAQRLTWQLAGHPGAFAFELEPFFEEVLGER
jgi:Uma2 family endonuclease